MMIRLIAASALVLAMTTPTVFAETLQVGAYPSNPPWEFKNEKSEFEGFEVDLVKEIAKRLGADLAISDLGFQALFAATASGRIDMAISSITITQERLQNQDFTQGYYDSDLGLLTNGEVTNLDGMKGKPVGALASSVGEKWISENTADKGFGEYKSYSDQQGLLLDTSNGRVAGAIGDILGFEYAAEQMKGIKVVERIKTGESFGIMLPKGSPNLERVNNAISEIKKDGTLAKIYEKWLKVAPVEGTSSTTVLPIPKAE
ncbi:ABC transporter substrate-binding protein [Pseudorhodobacter sp.]|uniref:ABC transporter substrate-binding protein n=1 Tax=Pseudorhodobacter sp. TaxID=1934400 RepID=UPI0026482E84|nr:ABC transporter substrate-binding protein [Pseudorhodobacter sp.]MDN5786148.1 ABC transporter substrate-binding protein [Pseudorhodobacter sp.]